MVTFQRLYYSSILYQNSTINTEHISFFSIFLCNFSYYAQTKQNKLKFFVKIILLKDKIKHGLLRST